MPEASALTGEESEWVFDYVMNLFRSAAWEVPIMTFIDENCIVFDNDDENKFVYTDLHEQFRDIVDNVISGNLTEIGVGPEEFADLCSRFRYETDISMEVVNQILAIDDFLTFKKLMVKRNMELELEAVQALREEESMIDDEIRANAEESFRKALVDTAKEIKDKPDEEVIPAEIAEYEELDSYGAELDAQLCAEMEANLAEMELLMSQEEIEQAELEEAIALSIAMEEEHLRLAELERKKKEDTQGGGGEDVAEGKKSTMTRRASFGKHVPLDPNVSVEEYSAQVADKKKKAEAAIEERQKELRQQREKHEELKKKTKVSEDEIARRARHLKKQREKILEKKKREREKKLQKYEQEQKESQPEPPQEISDRIAEGPVKSAAEDAKSQEAEDRRKALRVALARKMKQDLLETEESRVVQLQVKQFMDLDEKLKQVEGLRKEHRSKQEHVYKEVIDKQNLRSRNLRSCVKKGVLTEDDFEFSEG